MAVVEFTSSDAFIESDPAAVEHGEIVIHDYIEGTYEALRCGPDGDEIAHLKDGAWELPDGRRFSDWAVSV